MVEAIEPYFLKLLSSGLPAPLRLLSLNCIFELLRLPVPSAISSKKVSWRDKSEF